MTYRRLAAPAAFTYLALAACRLAAQQPAPVDVQASQQIAAPGVQLPPASNQLVAAAGIQAGVAPQGPAQAGAAVQPAGPPFQLTPVDQQFVLQTLQMWEQESAKVTTFNSEFERWEYDAVFGPEGDTAMIKAKGTLSFSKPDKGSFKIDEISRWTKKDPQNTAADAPGDWAAQPNEIGEHWVCDGKAVYEYNHRDKQLKVTTIPPEMRGQEIVNGPLPFLFGAKANDLMTRYWIRTKQSAPTEIWIEAYPRWQSDAANYDFVDVMLDRKTMQPKAIQVHLPGGQQRHVYMFKEPKINEKNLGAWFTGLFSSPRTPLGWTKVMADQAAAAPQAAKPQAAVQR
ncbi:MAG: TIGR03009 domain-containing protein [Pirellulales bacterium]|nr:TIGR03009 domain-containing protein [Pirellulales bacterium]